MATVESLNTKMKTDSSVSISKCIILPLAVLSLILFCALPSRGEATTNRVKIIRVPGAGKVLKAQRSADGTSRRLFRTHFNFVTPDLSGRSRPARDSKLVELF